MSGLLCLLSKWMGLDGPTWSHPLGPSGSPRREPPGDSGRGWEIENERLSGLDRESLGSDRVESLSHCALHGAVLKNLHIEQFEACNAELAELSHLTIRTMRLCDLRGARLREVDIEAADSSVLQEVQMDGGRLGAISLVDLRLARLGGVLIGRALAADFSGATLDACVLEGADLRGALFRGTLFKNMDLLGANWRDADLRGARGIDRATRARLLWQGARFSSPEWYRLVRFFAPRSEALRVERIAVAFSWFFAIVSVGLCLAALWAVLHPPPPRDIPEPPPARQRAASPVEIDQTQQNLARLREALRRAHESMIESGGPADSWPLIADLQQNRYDVDGRAPGEVRAELVRGGLPENLLTDAVGGVLPYCNDLPAQETLAGVEADWHYCDMTGRVFASAGATGLPTLEW